MSNTPIDGGLDFKVTLDDSQAKAKSQELQQEFGRIGKKATEAGTDIDALTAKMSQGFGEVATAATTAGNNIGAALASMDKKLSTLTPAIGKMGKEITTALDGVVEKTEPIEASGGGVLSSRADDSGYLRDYCATGLCSQYHSDTCGVPRLRGFVYHVPRLSTKG